MKITIRCEDLEDAIRKLEAAKDDPVLVRALDSDGVYTTYMDWGTIEDDD